MPKSDGSMRGDQPRRSAGLDAEEFCARLRQSFRTQWLIAVSIVREPMLAEDVVQEAGLIALGKLADFTPGTNFNAWVGRMVRYVALNYARKERKRRSPSLDALGEGPQAAATAGPAPWAGFKSGVLDERIVRELFALQETARACLLLRTVDGLSYAEIAELLDIPEGTAMSHVHRTRLHLRDRLSDLAPDGAAVRKES
jgi:RNA polymerase sigma-70 factor (ECF subfamily)